MHSKRKLIAIRNHEVWAWRRLSLAIFDEKMLVINLAAIMPDTIINYHHNLLPVQLHLGIFNNYVDDVV